MPNFVESSPSQAYLLPPDMREWVPEDDLSHFVLEAVERVPMSSFSVNERGTGSAQYHPRTMLALLIYCYANGIFGSRRVERATYRDLGARYVFGDRRPDHDTICKFRRENFAAVSEAFLEVLLMARELKLLRVGTVSVDGTKLDANASRRRSIRYDRARELREQLRVEIEGLMGEAERADAGDAPDPQALPEELKSRGALQARLDGACAELERRAKARAESERAEYEGKVAEREELDGHRKGKEIKPPSEEPRPEGQINLTDADSGLMRKNRRSEYRQCYNAQAVVDADGSQLVLGSRVSTCASDRGELVADVDAVPEAVGEPERVLADNGYANGGEVEELERRGLRREAGGGRGLEVLVAVGAGDRRRRHDFRPVAPEKPVSEPKAEWLRRMRDKMATEESRAYYRLRKQTVEPVFGIVKEAMGFRRFLLRGLGKVEGEWSLVTLAYNCRRLHNMKMA